MFLHYSTSSNLDCWLKPSWLRCTDPVVSAEMEQPVSPLQPLSDRFHMIPYYYGLIII